ncbi:flagellin [Actinotalea ferrariae]|uniref:flagellin N-terminal helical domain-containing protein n=1 Tax=Actinotalea ferrariae TaxID=1386098 RepID=UPI001C8BD62E|nr:flagellin [Actinotalea ferrariae]MBX9246635.1 flagellin [Actinotalea ferrariae]
MGLSINQNIAAVNSYRNLSNTQNDLSKSLEKLSSGFRINRAADDAAGLAISEGLRSQVGGLKVAVRNAQDGISVVQTAEGALTETHAILQRMRDLSVQGASTGGLSEDAKGNIQSEMSQLKDELTRIADTTQFNGAKLLDGSYDGKFQVGANVGESISVKVGTAMSASGLGVAGVDVTQDAVGSAAAASVTAVGGTTPVAGSVTIAGNAALSETFDNLSGTVTYGGKSIDLSTVKFEAGSSAASRLADLNTAVQAKLGTGVAAAAVGTTGISFTGTAPAADANTEAVAAAQVTFTQATGADDAIKKIDAAIKTVSTTRADLGAVQNRFDHTIKNLNVAVENLSASESRIRDTDMASEMVSFTRAQILSQAGTSMLAQANQIPQGVLSLLR